MAHPPSTPPIHRSALPLLGLGILIAVAALPLSAQLAVMERSPGHERLGFLIGTWSSESTQTILGEAAVVRSSSTYAWLSGGVWLRGETSIRGLPGIEVHHGWLQLTYDAEADQVVQLWYDNQSPLLFLSRGRWIDDRRLVVEGSHTWDGTTSHRREVYTLLSEDSFSREFLVADAEDGEYRRRSLTRYRRQR